MTRQVVMLLLSIMLTTMLLNGCGKKNVSEEIEPEQKTVIDVADEDITPVEIPPNENTDIPVSEEPEPVAEVEDNLYEIYYAILNNDMNVYVLKETGSDKYIDVLVEDISFANNLIMLRDMYQIKANYEELEDTTMEKKYNEYLINKNLYIHGEVEFDDSDDDEFNPEENEEEINEEENEEEINEEENEEEINDEEINDEEESTEIVEDTAEENEDESDVVDMPQEETNFTLYRLTSVDIYKDGEFIKQASSAEEIIALVAN